MSQTLLFPTDTTDKGTITDAGTNTGGLTIDGKPVCLLGSKVTHPQGPDILLNCSPGITLDGMPLALSGGSTALGAIQLPALAIMIDIEAGNVATGNALAPKVLGSQIKEFNEDKLESTLAHTAFLKFANNTDEYFFCWHLLCIFGAGPGVDAYRKLYKEARDGSLKNPPIHTVANDIVKYAGFSPSRECIYINREFILFANEQLTDEEPDTAKADDKQYDKSIWLSRVRLAAALVEEYGEYIYAHLWKIAGKKIKDAGYDAGATYAFNVLSDTMPEDKEINIIKGSVKDKLVNITLQFKWWHAHIAEITETNEGEDSTAQDGETELEDGEIIKKFGQGDGEILHERYHHGGIQREALKSIFPLQIPNLYYGNWLRDVSQAIDRLLLSTSGEYGKQKGMEAGKKMWVGCMNFSGTKEFILHPLKEDFDAVWEVVKSPINIIITDEKRKKLKNAAKYLYYCVHFLKAEEAFANEFGDIHQYIGCYRSEEHIDNPHQITKAETLMLNVADLQTDANLGEHSKCTLLQLNYDWYMKNYIRNGTDSYLTIGKGPTITAAAFITAKLTQACIKGNTIEGRIALGAALHTLQDYYAHSNYCEILLIAKGHNNVFPWVETGKYSIPDDFIVKEPFYTPVVKKPEPVYEIKRLVMAYCAEYTGKLPNKLKPTLPVNQPGQGPERASIIINTLPVPEYRTRVYIKSIIQPDRFSTYKPGPNGYVITKDWKKNVYPEEWTIYDNAYNRIVELPEVLNGHWKINKLQELVIYSNGSAVFDIYEPKIKRGAAYLPKYNPAIPRRQEILEEITLFRYNPYKLPVVTGKFGAFDAVHSLTDMVKENFTPASWQNEVLGNFLETVEKLADDLLKDAKKGGFRSDTQKEKLAYTGSLFAKAGGISEEISFSFDSLLKLITQFVSDTGGQFGENNRKDIDKTVKEANEVNEQNQKMLKKAFVKMLDLLGNLSTLNKEQLKKLVTSIKNVKTYYKALGMFVLKLVPMLMGYVVAWVARIVSGAIKSFQDYANELMRKCNYSLEDKTIHSYGLFTNPTHSQLAKDDYEKPLHTLAGKLAVFATREIGTLVDKCWNNKGVITSQILDSALQFITHPLDARNKHMTGKYGIEEMVVIPWISENLDKIAEASKPKVRQWIINTLKSVIDAYNAMKQAAIQIGEKVVEMMKLIDKKIDDVKNAYDELERKTKEGFYKMEQELNNMIERSEKKLQQTIEELIIKMNIELEDASRYSIAQGNRELNRERQAAPYIQSINYCKAEIAALRDINPARTIAVLDRWCKRKYDNRFSALKEKQIIIT